MPLELQPATVRRPPAARGRIALTRGLALFLAGHVLLGILLRVAPPLATVHALAAFTIGLFIAATRRPRDVAAVVAYITGSEVLWRLSHAAVFHEAGKYAIVAVLLV